MIKKINFSKDNGIMSLKFLKEILQQRNKRKALIMDVIPFFCFWIFFAVVLLSILVVFFLSLFTSNAQHFESHQVAVDPAKNSLTFVKEKVSPLYGDAKLQLSFPFSRNISGIFDPYFDMTVVVAQKIWFSEEWFPLVDKKVQKPLICDPRSSHCSAVTVLSANPATIGVHIPLMSRDFQFTILLGDSFVALRNANFLSNDIVGISFSYRQPLATLFEIFVRVLFGVIAGWMFIGFGLLVCTYQSFPQFHTMQKWLLVELFLHFWFQNPFYFVEVFIPHFYLFPMINFLISNAFIFVFLLHALVFFHSIVKHPKQRNLCTFYFPKIILVACWFLYAIYAELYTILNNVVDPTSTSENLGYFSLIGVFFFIVYVMFLLYYVVRSIGFVMNPSSQTLSNLKSSLEKVRMSKALENADNEDQNEEEQDQLNQTSKPKLRRLAMQEEMLQKRIDKLETIQKLQKRVHAKYSTRFFFVGALSFLVLFAFCIRYMAAILQFSDALDFLPQCFVIGVFFFAMSILYLPSSLTEEDFLKITELKKARKALRMKKILERNGNKLGNGQEEKQQEMNEVLSGPGVEVEEHVDEQEEANVEDVHVSEQQQQPEELQQQQNDDDNNIIDNFNDDNNVEHNEDLN